MVLKKFGLWVVKNLIILLLITFIFSTAALDAPSLIKDIFKDIFQYSSPEMQKEVASKLTTACSGLEGRDFEGFGNLSIPVSLDFKKIGALCKDYKSSKINDKEFFFSVIGTAFPEKLELSKFNALEKYNSIIDFLNKNKIIYFVVLAVLLVLLHLLIMNIKLFMLALTGISFSMGILILLPYGAIIAYDKFVGIDTTPILATILSGSFSLDAKAIISVILLMMLRTYSSFIITLGILFLSVGIGGKIYNWKLKRQRKTVETKKKSEKEEPKKAKAAKEEKIKLKKDDAADEAYKHRDRSTKEILDELEEMHKKKIKEKENS